MYVCTYVYKQIYQEMSSYTRLPHLGQETFWHPLLTNKLATMTQSDQTTITLNHHMTLYACFSPKMQRQLRR